MSWVLFMKFKLFLVCANIYCQAHSSSIPAYFKISSHPMKLSKRSNIPVSLRFYSTKLSITFQTSSIIVNPKNEITDDPECNTTNTSISIPVKNFILKKKFQIPNHPSAPTTPSINVTCLYLVFMFFIPIQLCFSFHPL